MVLSDWIINYGPTWLFGIIMQGILMIMLKLWPYLLGCSFQSLAVIVETDASMACFLWNAWDLAISLDFVNLLQTLLAMNFISGNVFRENCYRLFLFCISHSKVKLCTLLIKYPYYL